MLADNAIEVKGGMLTAIMSVHVLVPNVLNVECLLVFVIVKLLVIVNTVERVANNGNKSVQQDQIVEEQAEEPLEPNQVNVKHYCTIRLFAFIVIMHLFPVFVRWCCNITNCVTEILNVVAQQWNHRIVSLIELRTCYSSQPSKENDPREYEECCFENIMHTLSHNLSKVTKR